MNPFLERLRQQKIGVGVFLVLVLLPVVALVVSWPPPPPPVDGKSCRPGLPERHRIVLLDTTDALDQTQRDSVLNAVETEAADAALYEKLTVASIDERDPRNPKILFAACAPQRDSLGPDENPALLRANWLRRFHDPLIAAVKAAMTAPEQKETPLIESVYGIGRRADFSPAVAHRRLLIVSDMLQHTGLYSLYGEAPDFAVFARKPDALQNVPNLSGVAVVSLYLDRSGMGCHQGDAQRKFWEDYFRDAGTSIAIPNWPWLHRTPLSQGLCRAAGHGVPPRLRPKHHKRPHHHALPDDGLTFPP